MGTLSPYGRRLVVPHDLFEPGVYGAEQRSEPPRLSGRQLGAVAVEAVHPVVQGIALPLDDGDGVTVRVRQGRRYRHTERVQLLGRPVLSHDRVVITAGVVEMVLVEVVLEEVRAPGGGHAVTVVEQALGQGFAGEGFMRRRGSGAAPRRPEEQVEGSQMSAALATC